jgi:hypothetical protein
MNEDESIDKKLGWNRIFNNDAYVPDDMKKLFKDNMDFVEQHTGYRFEIWLDGLAVFSTKTGLSTFVENTNLACYFFMSILTDVYEDGKLAGISEAMEIVKNERRQNE